MMRGPSGFDRRQRRGFRPTRACRCSSRTWTCGGRSPRRRSIASGAPWTPTRTTSKACSRARRLRRSPARPTLRPSFDRCLPATPMGSSGAVHNHACTRLSSPRRRVGAGSREADGRDPRREPEDIADCSCGSKSACPPARNSSPRTRWIQHGERSAKLSVCCRVCEDDDRALRQVRKRVAPVGSGRCPVVDDRAHADWRGTISSDDDDVHADVRRGDTASGSHFEHLAGQRSRDRGGWREWSGRCRW